MARVELDETILKTVSGATGPASGASVTVNRRGTSTAATIYQTETGSSTFGNPLTADANGGLTGWLEEGAYDLGITIGGVSVGTIPWEAVSGQRVLNVRAFGAKGDGTTDDTTAFQAWRDAMAAALTSDTADSGSGFVRATVRGYVPPGRYLITAAEAMMTNVSGSTGAFGYEVFGDGEATHIVYSGTGPLFKNYNDYLYPKVSNINFYGGSSASVFWLNQSAGTAQGAEFVDVLWSGTWSDRFQLSDFGGTANGNDSFKFTRCRDYATAAAGKYFFNSGTTSGLVQQDQAIAHEATDCNLEPRGGGIFKFQYGGHLTVNGGSMLLIAGGDRAFLMPIIATHNSGVLHLKVQGTRFEVRDTSAKVIECFWTGGTVEFDNVSTDGYATPSTQVLASFEPFNGGAAGTGPKVTWRGCSLNGKHEYVHRTNQYQAGRSRARYESCEITAYTDPSSFITLTDRSAGGAIGSGWVVEFDDSCRTFTTSGAESQGRGYHTMLNWDRQIGAETREYWKWFETSFGVLPQNGATIDIKVPLNSRVTGFHFMHPAKAGGAATTNWSVTLVSDPAGTPVTLYNSGTIATAWNLGYEEYKELRKTTPGSGAPGMVLLDTDAKRTLRLTVATVNDSYPFDLFGVRLMPGS